MENKTPTAEEFLNNKFKKIYYKQPEGLTSKLSESRYLELHVTGRIDGREQNYPEMMIEFAKLHVEAALNEVTEKLYFRDSDGHVIRSEESNKLVLKVYPLTNIK